MARVRYIKVNQTSSQKNSPRVTVETAFSQLAEPRKADGLDCYNIQDFI